MTEEAMRRAAKVKRESSPIRRKASRRAAWEKRSLDRRKVERRQTPKRGVNVRHDDGDGQVPKRMRRGKQ